MEKSMVAIVTLVLGLSVSVVTAQQNNYQMHSAKLRCYTKYSITTEGFMCNGDYGNCVNQMKPTLNPRKNSQDCQSSRYCYWVYNDNTKKMYQGCSDVDKCLEGAVRQRSTDCSSASLQQAGHNFGAAGESCQMYCCNINECNNNSNQVVVSLVLVTIATILARLL